MEDVATFGRGNEVLVKRLKANWTFRVLRFGGHFIYLILLAVAQEDLMNVSLYFCPSVEMCPPEYTS